MNDDDDLPINEEQDAGERLNPPARDALPPMDKNGDLFPGFPLQPLEGGVTDDLAANAGQNVGEIPVPDIADSKDVEPREVEQLHVDVGDENAKAPPQPTKRKPIDWDKVKESRNWYESWRTFRKTGKHSKWGQEQIAKLDAAAGRVPEPEAKAVEAGRVPEPEAEAVEADPGDEAEDDVDAAWDQWRMARGNAPGDVVRKAQPDKHVDAANPQGDDKDLNEATLGALSEYLKMERDFRRSLLSLLVEARTDLQNDYNRLQDLLTSFERGREGY